MAVLMSAVAADGEDHRIGAAAFRLGQDPLDHVLLPRMNWMLEAEARGNGVALRVEIGGEHLCPGAQGERTHASGRWGPGR